ncbi:hypothetical protein CH063_14452 [Colletotrichum higginsianum]|uniref:Uncharacterized protein n=1 Tax=Colletotrichum higginsianum (strain IMI 349063) TaxID=759273 RepID=H1VYL7_COLHI|nr:hypothetical protein CH063_14452 [Colletotrichum higginsianum]
MERLLFSGVGSLLRSTPPAARGEGFGRAAPTGRSAPVRPFVFRVLGKGHRSSGRLRARVSGHSATAGPGTRLCGRQA